MKEASCAIFGLALLCVATSPAAAEWHFVGSDSATDAPEYDTPLFLHRPDPLNIRVRHLDLDAPRVVGGRLGYRFENTSALDVGVETYHFAWDHAGGDAGGAHPASGLGPNMGFHPIDPQLSMLSLNARYRVRGLRTSDFPEGRVQPFAGVSVGTYFQHLRSHSDLLGTDETLYGDTGPLGFEGFLGSTYFLSRETALFAQYRLRHTQKLDFDLGNSGVELGLRANEWTSFELDLSSDEWHGEFKLNF